MLFGVSVVLAAAPCPAVAAFAAAALGCAGAAPRIVASGMTSRTAGFDFSRDSSPGETVVATALTSV